MSVHPHYQQGKDNCHVISKWIPRIPIAFSVLILPVPEKGKEAGYGIPAARNDTQLLQVRLGRMHALR
jgi:hypothetical protein